MGHWRLFSFFYCRTVKVDVDGCVLSVVCYNLYVVITVTLSWRLIQVEKKYCSKNFESKAVYVCFRMINNDEFVICELCFQYTAFSNWLLVLNNLFPEMDITKLWNVCVLHPLAKKHSQNNENYRKPPTQCVLTLVLTVCIVFVLNTYISFSPLLACIDTG